MVVMNATGAVLLVLSSLLFQDPDIESLIKRLDDESVEARNKAVTGLVALGDKVEPRLKSLLASSKGQLKSQVESVLQAIRRNRNLAAVLPPVKKITLEGKDKPWKEYAKEFQDQSGWTLNLESAPEGRVTLSIAGVSPFEALDALCRAAETGYQIESLGPFARKPGEPRGLVPPVDILDDPSGVTFHRDRHRLGPCLYIRQYSLSMGAVGLMKVNNFKAPVSQGMVSLQLSWPPTARPEAVRAFQVVSIRTDMGEELHDPKLDLDSLIEDVSPPMLWPEGRVKQLSFRYPSADARKISVKGRAVLTYGVDDVVVAFPNPGSAVGDKKDFDGVRIHLTEYRKEKNNDVFLSFDVTGKRLTPPAGRRRCFASGDVEMKLGILKEFVRIRTQGGEVPQQVDTGLYIKPDRYVVRLEYRDVKSEIEGIDFIMETVYHTDSFEFEFKDVELPK